MRFPNKFVRYIGAGLSPLLGSDVDPTTLSPYVQKQYLGNDNVLVSRTLNVGGFPMQRVAIGWSYSGAGAPAVAPVTVFIWDDNSERWYKVYHASVVSIPVNNITFLDVCTLLDFPHTTPGAGMLPTGALEYAILVGAPVAAPDGMYTIIAGCDVSNPGV